MDELPLVKPLRIFEDRIKMRKDDIPAVFVGVGCAFRLDLVIKLPDGLLFIWRKVQGLVGLIVEETIFFDLRMKGMPNQIIFVKEDQKGILFKFEIDKFQ